MAYQGYVKGRITVEQVFAAANPVLLNPQLPACIVGPAYQIVRESSTGEEYDWDNGNSGIAYPELIVGNTVDTSDTIYEPTVYIKTKLSTGAYRTYQVSSNDVTFNALNFDISSNLIQELIDWHLGYTGKINSAGDEFTETNRSFFGYDIKPGDQICFNASEVNQDPTWYDISSVSGDKVFGDFNDVIALYDNGSTIADETAAANNDTVDDMHLEGGKNTTYYFGHASLKFGKIALKHVTKDINSLVTWKYWDGSTWSTLTVTASQTDWDQWKVDGDGYVTFNIPADWEKTTVQVSGGTNYNGYWVQAEETGSSATEATADSCTLSNFDTSTAYTYEIRRKLGGTDSDILISYRALRADTPLLGLQTFSSVDDIQDNLGTISAANPLAMGVYFAMLNTTTSVYGLAVEDTIDASNPTKWQDAFDILGQHEVYSIVPLTQSTTIHGYLKSHVENYSDKTVGKERIGFINRELIEYDNLIDLGSGDYVRQGAIDISLSKLVIDGSDLSSKLSAGNSVYDYVNDKFYLITSVTYDGINDISEVSLNTTPDLSDMYILSGTSRTGSYDSAKLVITGGETEPTPLSTVLAISNETWIYKTDDGKIYHIDSVQAKSGSPEDTEIILSSYTGTPYDPPAGTGTWTVRFLRWNTKFVNMAYDKDEQAEQIANYASSFDERRIVLVWPDLITYDDSLLGNDTRMEGFYLGCAIAGMVSAYSPSQGFTNLPFTGAKTLLHSNNYFTSNLPGCQLDHMADGGVYIVTQASSGGPMVSRHQLTTDMSSTKEMELQSTRCLDYAAKMFRNALSNDLGINNITATYLSLLMGTAVKVADKLLSEGVLTKADPQDPTVSGSQISMKIETDVPVPVNSEALVLYVNS